MFNGYSNIAGGVDFAMALIIGISVALLVGVTFAMIYFAIKYRHSRHPEAEEIDGNAGLEITWTVIPTVLVLVMFYYGYLGFAVMRDVPEDARVVKVTARMWSWLFEYENGARSDRLVLPVGEPVKLALHSTDVIHSLFIPAFRVKEDAVPGQETYMWFIPEKEGTYDLFCTEYCGRGHSSMITKVDVLGRDGFDGWLEEHAPKPAADKGGSARAEDLMSEYGCLGCHSMDGSVLVGPSLKGLFGRKVMVEADGKTVERTADAEYIRRSLLDPNAEVVEGFAPMMPSMQGALGDDDIDALIDYFERDSK